MPRKAGGAGKALRALGRPSKPIPSAALCVRAAIDSAAFLPEPLKQPVPVPLLPAPVLLLPRPAICRDSPEAAIGSIACFPGFLKQPVPVSLLPASPQLLLCPGICGDSSKAATGSIASFRSDPIRTDPTVVPSPPSASPPSAPTATAPSTLPAGPSRPACAASATTRSSSDPLLRYAAPLRPLLSGRPPLSCTTSWEEIGEGVSPSIISFLPESESVAAQVSGGGGVRRIPPTHSGVGPAWVARGRCGDDLRIPCSICFRSAAPRKSLR